MSHDQYRPIIAFLSEYIQQFNTNLSKVNYNQIDTWKELISIGPISDKMIFSGHTRIAHYVVKQVVAPLLL